MSGRRTSLRRSCRGSAGVEMALVLPLLLLIMFGSVEMGNFFLSEHVVQKGVRDGARFAARLPLASLTPSGCGLTTDTTTLDEIKNVARTGDPDAADDRLGFWDSNSTVSVGVACTDASSWSTKGVYADFPAGAPVITVTASVPYQPLFDFLPFVGDGMTLNAASQAAVFGA